jgi:hypothetical protein
MIEYLLGGLGLGFGLGYLTGRVDSILRILRGTESTSFVATVAKEQKQRKKIDIDDAKFVTDVSTSGMQSLSKEPLGKVSQTSDDIASATSKLAQLKKMKG